MPARKHTPPSGPRRARNLPIALVLALLALALVGPASALAKGGGGGDGGGHGGGRGDDRPEVRVAGQCGRGATSTLKLKARDGGIEAEFEVHGRRGLWRVSIVQEQQLAYRGHARSGGFSRSFSVERRLGDYPGPDQVLARAIGPHGITCSATATLPG
jgi:hypothetical protein